MKKITVIGCGYVGLVTATCLAEVGHTVFCLDIDEKKIAALRQGTIPIYEPGLHELVLKNVHQGRLHFTSVYADALHDAQLVMIAVDTPPQKDGSCNTRNLERVAQTIGETVEHDIAIVIKSTVPVGTASHISTLIANSLEKRHLKIWFEVISNPEFLREGHAIEDFMHPDRIIIGLSSERAEEMMRTLYQPFGHKPSQLFFMDTASSELTKYASNSMLALRISFMNSLARLCDATGADIELIKRGMGSDTRIGPAFLNAGLGYGGSCFPKDVKALEFMMRQYSLSSDIITAVDATNEQQKGLLGDKIYAFFEPQGGLHGKTIAILGLSFKPDTDDMREAPSLVLINQLLAQGALIRVFDPVAMKNTKMILGEISQVTFCESEEEACADAHAIALVTEWAQFKKLDYRKILSKMQANAFFDGRNQFSPEDMQAQGFSYICIGRKPLYTRQETSHPLPTKVLFES